MRFVGLGVAVWAFGSAIGSFVLGRVVKYVRRFTLFLTSTLLSISLCLFLIFFGQEDSFTLVFLVSLGFGLSDGILKTGISCEQCTVLTCMAKLNVYFTDKFPFSLSILCALWYLIMLYM